jgi:16S rRNA processing protein RimM
MTEEDWLVIGTIVAPQGLRGELRVYPNSDFPERFEEPGQRWLQKPGDTEPQPIELIGGRFIPGKGIYAVQLAGVHSREEAEALRDANLLVPESDRPELGDDEYHVLDLLNLEVVNQLTDEAIGTVVDVIPAGNDLLEVKLYKQPVVSTTEPEPPLANKKRKPKKEKPITVLIPFVKEIAPVVDFQKGRIEITPPSGLLEVNEG